MVYCGVQLNVPCCLNWSLWHVTPSAMLHLLELPPSDCNTTNMDQWWIEWDTLDHMFNVLLSQVS